MQVLGGLRVAKASMVGSPKRAATLSPSKDKAFQNSRKRRVDEVLEFELIHAGSLRVVVGLCCFGLGGRSPPKAEKPPAPWNTWESLYMAPKALKP